MENIEVLSIVDTTMKNWEGIYKYCGKGKKMKERSTQLGHLAKNMFYQTCNNNNKLQWIKNIATIIRHTTTEQPPNWQQEQRGHYTNQIGGMSPTDVTVTCVISKWGHHTSCQVWDTGDDDT